MENPDQLIERALGPYTVAGKSYPGPLPEELAPWYCYTVDGGHCIAIVSEDHAAVARGGPADHLVPAPVKAVLRSGYRVIPGEPGLVVAKLPYSSEVGLLGVRDDDHEFDPADTPGEVAAGRSMLEVGERYPAMTFPVPEIGEYNYYEGGHELRLFWNSPSEREILAVRQGEARFALNVHGDVIFLLYRFGDLPWSDAPFSYHLVPDDRKGDIPETGSPESRALLLTILVDASTGTIHALRGLSLSPDFTRRLGAAIRRQATAPWPGPAAYNAQVREAYARFPDSANMAKAATARSRGGG